MAMLTKHLIIGEEFYIDPLDGNNNVIKCTLIAQNPNNHQLYIFKSISKGTLYISHQNNVYKKKNYALKGQQVRRIKQGGRDRVDNIAEMIRSIEKISHHSGESGYRIRHIIKRNQHLFSTHQKQLPEK